MQTISRPIPGPFGGVLALVPVSSTLTIEEVDTVRDVSATPARDDDRRIFLRIAEKDVALAAHVALELYIQLGEALFEKA